MKQLMAQQAKPLQIRSSIMIDLALVWVGIIGLGVLIYVVMDGFKLCVTCGLPERRLRPLNQKELTNQKSING